MDPEQVCDEAVGPGGEELMARGWTGRHRDGRRLVQRATHLGVRDYLGVTWVADPAAWWSEHAPQVVTADHPAEQPHPERPVYRLSAWRSPGGTVVLADEDC